MNRRRILRAAIVLGSSGGIASLAGCSGGSAPTATPTPQSTTSGSTTTTGGGSGGKPTVSVASASSVGSFLVGPEGLSLYMFEPDTKGARASTCSGSCAKVWPPLTTSGSPTKGSKVTAALSTFERDDGSTQVAANGWPPYYYAGDASAGDTNGQGLDANGGRWYLLGPGGTPLKTGGSASTGTTTG